MSVERVAGDYFELVETFSAQVCTATLRHMEHGVGESNTLFGGDWRTLIKVLFRRQVLAAIGDTMP